uniref:dUTPase-like domain-containing protein n=1 Tax=Gopherus agassizii TaxID=38772 RepID=A0A452H6X5_9SAUR
MVEACNRTSVYEETDKEEIHAKAHASALAVALRPLVRPSKPPRPSGLPQPQAGCLEYLTGATQGSAGVDLATAADVTLDNDKVQIVPSVVNGPLGYGLSALLIGRSSMSKQGLFVLPGLIDTDYTGNIGIMVRALFPPVNIAAGTRIAQLIPFQGSVPKTKLTERGSHGFGSTDSSQSGKNKGSSVLIKSDSFCSCVNCKSFLCSA